MFALNVRHLILQLQALAAPILPATIAIRLESIDVDVQDFDSATSARAELDALVPAVEDALQAIDRRPGRLLSGSLRQLLEEWSIVHGIASLRTLGGSAHGHGRRPYRLQARHARLAVQSAHVFIEFFVETWNYHERRRSSG